MPLRKEQEPPPLPSLSPLLKSIIRLLEVQLAIPYPSKALQQSPEADHQPILRVIAKIIIALAEQHPDCGSHGAHILKSWLDVEHEQFPEAADAITMLEDNDMLSQLYSRGIIHQSPPQLAVEPAHETATFLTTEQRITNIKIQGEDRQVILLRTSPAYRLWIKAKFTVNLPEHTTSHKLQFLVDTTLTRFPDINTFGYDQYCSRQTYATARPLKIMIFNAAGGANPEFILSFAANSFEEKPYLVIITETRMSGSQGAQARQAMGFQATASIDPQGFFGGTWCLWNDLPFTFSVLSRDMNSLTAQLTM
ncbi:hypothetical protein CCACVL1_22758 [Corchorus capsularis]|uniref:Uncharacterized protein n=1 Tax=Corchorus capsularis TaxID=210143 RepID=A0A1R3GX21_COCAP|nr:hypothetical protein CCACVL1_22758 [Corchorus capsularis]